MSTENRSRRLLVVNGRLALPGADEPTDGEIAIVDGRIAQIGRGLERAGATIIDARGLLVLPGAIDPHVHFFDPGYTHKEDFFHGSSASASGGVTTVIDMPDTSDPAAIDGASVEAKWRSVGERSVIDFGLFGGISGALCDGDLERRIAEMSTEVCGIKTYETSGAAHFPRVSHWQYTEILPLTRAHDAIVLVHAEDWDLVSGGTPVWRAAGSSPRDFYRSRPELAEVLSVFSVTEIAETVGAPMHIVHLGVGRAAEIVAGRTVVSGETCPQYLAFDVDDFERAGGAMKITPPVKGPAEKERLWEMLSDGAIDFIASDHAPGTVEEKSTGDIWTDYAGIPGGPVVFPYALSEGYLSGRMGLARFVEITSGAAARRYRLDDRKGAIAIGRDADLVFVDPAGTTTVDAATSLSKGRVTPWDGRTLKGAVERTMVRGETVWTRETGLEVDAGFGEFLRPDRRTSAAAWRRAPYPRRGMADAAGTGS
jgi:allantoinase